TRVDARATPAEARGPDGPTRAWVRIEDRAPIAALVARVTQAPATPRVERLLVTLDGVTSGWHVADGAAPGVLWVGAGGAAWPLAEWVREPGAAAVAAGDGQARSPMPGTVIAVDVAAGDVVAAGQRLAVVEAMKMEHAVTAPVAGLVKDVLVTVGARVDLDALLAVVEAASPDEAGAES
ncbi:acetyl/propionyl-CoA carboxylase subunit alpha, partial [Frankia sp. CNm7]